MNRARRTSWAALLLVLASCATTFTEPGHLERSVMVERVDPEVMRAAIVETLNRRRERIDAERPGQIHTTIVRGRRALAVRISYGEQGFDVAYVDAAGFETMPGAGGSTLLDDRYVGWIRKLRRGIDLELTTRLQAVAEREAAARDAELAQARAQENAAAMELERERLARQPTPAYAPQQALGVGGQTAGPAPLRGGFNVTREPNGLGAASLVVRNEGSNPLHVIQMRAAGASQWRSNQLQRTVPTRSEYAVTGIAPGTWEVHVETLYGHKEWRHVRLGGGGEYTLVVTDNGWHR